MLCLHPRLASYLLQPLRILSHRSIWKGLYTLCEGHMEDDERPRHRRTRYRLPDWTRNHYGLVICLISLRVAGVLVPAVH